ncbi:MAG: hypothetical protein GY811_21020 [Myxococcales bacterium]|nr:hypothetical protein [Myxococcales bacterium]
MLQPFESVVRCEAIGNHAQARLVTLQWVFERDEYHTWVWERDRKVLRALDETCGELALLFGSLEDFERDRSEDVR